MTAREIAALAVQALEDKKAGDIKVLDISKVSTLGDYFVLCEGTSTTQVKALACLLYTSSQINRHFSRIFVDLFGGGKAALSLTDPENVLESGIDIQVAPPGKIINNLQSLSGGEQAFVAIAIYFAILTVHPSPFCILDEIEAALDDVNVNKYAAYLRTRCV